MATSEALDIAALRLQLADVTRRLGDATRRAERLRAVIEGISRQLELEPLLGEVIASAVDLLGADYGNAGLVEGDPGQPVIRTAAAYNMPPREPGAESGPRSGLAGLVLRERRPIVLERYGDLPTARAPEMADDTVLGLPIWWADRMIGFLGVGAQPPRRFVESDIETLALLARHAAIAIVNARHFDAERRRAARVATVNHIGRLITGSLSLDEILQTAVDAIHENLHYRNVAVLLPDAEASAMLVLRARGGDLRALDDYRQHIDTGIVGWAGRNRQRALVNDVARDPRFVPVPGIDTITSELALPLVAGDRVLGVLDIESDRPIGEDDAAAFEIVADQLGVAIANAELFATVEGMLDQTRLLYETSQRISTAMTVEEVVAAYLEQVALRGRYACTVVLYEFDAAGERIAVDLCGRWLPGHQGIDFTPERIPYTVRLLDPALDAGETVRISDVFTDPRASQTLREIQRASGRPALAFIPLIARGTRIGAVILSYPSVHSWPEAELRPYEITAAQLATALDTRMQQQLFYERGRQLAVVAERQRIARELHDSITQNLFSMTLAAQTISTAFERDAAEGNQRVGRLLELGQQALVEMRALLAELHPLESPSTPESTGGAVPTIYLVRRQGLVTALRTHVAGLTDDSVAVTLDSEGYISQPEEWEEPLFRIAQEALNNVAKHARARHVTIRLTTSEGQTYLAVTDDGVGFSSGPAPAGAAIGQLGLTSMRERAASLGARLDVRSAPGAGTTVEVILPAVKASRV